MQNVIVIYYNGSEYAAKRFETDFVDSSQPHIFDLPPEAEVIAVITNPGKTSEVYIDETLVLEELD